MSPPGVAHAPDAMMSSGENGTKNGETIVKQLNCGDAGFDCEAVVQGETTEEVLEQVRPHAQAEHGVTVTPEMEGELAKLVRDV